MDISQQFAWTDFYTSMIFNTDSLIYHCVRQARQLFTGLTPSFAMTMKTLQKGRSGASRLILRQMMGCFIVALALCSALAYAGAFGVYSHHRSVLSHSDIDGVIAHVHQEMIEESPMALLFDMPPTRPGSVDLEDLTAKRFKASVQTGVQTSALIPSAPEPVDEWLFWENEPDEPDAMAWPLEQFGISSHYGPRFGRFHHGMDLTAPVGSTIYSVDSGVVVQAGFMQGYGMVIMVDHGDGVKTRYAHLGRRLVKTGDWVYRHQMLGSVGMTGHTTGPHLHFEVMVYGQSRNPMRYLEPRHKIAARQKSYLYRRL